MLMKKAIALGAATLAAALLSSHASAANLVTDGTFQNVTNGVNARVVNAVAFGHDTSLKDWNIGKATGTGSGPATAINYLVAPGWTATGATSGSNPVPGFNVWSPNTGSNNGFYDVADSSHPIAPTGNYIVADGGSPYRGTISQTINNLTVNKTYAVSFLWAVGQQSSTQGATSNNAWNVTFGSATQTTDLKSIPSKGFSGWFQQTMTFTATSSSQLLSFLAQGQPDGIPPLVFLADVSVKSVPEPSAVVMLGLGVVGLAGLGLRRRNAR